MYIRGEVLQACFGDPPVSYNMLLYTKDGTSYAMFATFEAERQRWVGTRLPFILTINPDLLAAFTEALLKNGYVLQTLKSDSAVKP